MDKGEEIDQFQLLEEKVDSLITLVTSLRKENEVLIEKISSKDGKIADLTGEVEHLKASMDRAKERMVSLVEKIEQLNI
jgi:peptidoglycan hydrolase CwlO-like protein